MSTEERIEKLENRVEKIEDKFHDKEISSVEKYNELKDLISSAVKEGNREIFSKLTNLEERVDALEDKDGEKAILILKSIGATTLGWIVLGLLNNCITIFNK